MGDPDSKNQMFDPKSKAPHFQNVEFTVHELKHEYERQQCLVTERNCVCGWTQKDKEKINLKDRRRFSLITKMPMPAPTRLSPRGHTISVPDPLAVTWPVQNYWIFLWPLQNRKQSCIKRKWGYFFILNSMPSLSIVFVSNPCSSPNSLKDSNCEQENKVFIQ